MWDPVCTIDGQTYEKSAIQESIDRGFHISPLTGAKLERDGRVDTILIPNHILRNEIQDWVKSRLCSKVNHIYGNQSLCMVYIYFIFIQ
jgi:hypothetical protein